MTRHPRQPPPLSDAPAPPERALPLSREQLEFITDSAPVFILHIDSDCRYRYVNRTYARRFNRSPQEIIGKHLVDIIGELAFARFKPYVDTVLAGQAVDFEIDAPYDVIGLHHVHCAYTPEFDAAGNTVGFIAVLSDVTEHRQAEAANRAKDQFLAVLSHELRTPLTPVLTAAQLLQSDRALNDEHRDLAAMIARNAELEARLIDDLLDLTRISRGKFVLHFGVINAHEKVRDVVEMCDADIRAGQLRLVLDLAAAKHIIRADSTRFQQILWNLLKNAVKFTSPGGSITISTSNSADGRLSIAVRDTGVGIAREVLPKIFDAFQQGSGEVTRLFGGLGLGLTIAKALAEAHGGRLHAQSEGTGLGSTFTVEFPTSLEPVDEDLADAPLDSASRRPCRILLVEDHADTAKAMAKLLGGYGYAVQTADSVAAALQAAKAQAFNIIISDLGLPDGSGHDLMQQLLKRSPIVGIALSGYGMDEDITRSRQAGFVEHLIKPVNMQLLRQTLDRITRDRVALATPQSATATAEP